MNSGSSFLQGSCRIIVILLFASGPCIGPKLWSAPAPRTGLVTPEGPESGARRYLAGMDALNQNNYSQAIAELSQALQADPDNQEYVRARGVAETLAEQFPAGIRDLERAMKLDPRDPEARLWLAAALRMSGNPGRGASLFFYDQRLPKTYTELIYQRMAHDYWSSTQQGHYFDRRTGENVETSQAQRELFPEVAAAYVQRHKPSGPAATQLVREGVEAKLAQGDVRGARPDLLALLQSRPEDLDVQKQWTHALAELHNHPGTRAQATYVLGIDPLWAEGYILRAQAAAAMGNIPRAKADLDAAKRLDPEKGTAAEKQLVHSFTTPSAPANAVPDFMEQVQTGAPWEKLVQTAVQVGRWNEGHTKRYDESWQERLWLLAEARRTEPKDPDRLEMEARYLFNTATVPRVWDGPRAEPRALRRLNQSDAQREGKQSIAWCDEALKLDPRHVPAIATKAGVLFRFGQAKAAESVAQEGLALEPDCVPLLELNAQYLEQAAMAVAAPALGLRAGHTETSYEHRADGTYRRETHYGPTAAQTAQADALLREAAAIRQEAQASMERARSVKSKKIPDLLARAERALKGKDGKAAEVACRQALQLWPDSPEGLALMARIQAQLGHAAEAQIYALFPQPIPFTTDADELKQAWTDIERTAFKTAEGSLDRAAALDPTDARVLACRGVVAEARNDEASAEHWREGALALEEARARAEGTSFQEPASEPLEVQDIGLVLALRQRSAETQLSAHPERALELERGIGALERRLPKNSIYELIPRGMLPDPKLATGHIGDAPSAAALFAWAHLRMGQAFVALHRPKEAQREFQNVAAYANGWPATLPGRGTLAEVEGWSCVGLIKLAMEEGRWDDAGRMVSHCGGAGGPNSPELGQARSEVAEAYFQHARNGGSVQVPVSNPREPGFEELQRISRQYVPKSRQ